MNDIAFTTQMLLRRLPSAVAPDSAEPEISPTGADQLV
jgi:hypothetical protein